MNEPLHGLPENAHISPNRLQFLTTIDNIDIWWDEQDRDGYPYLLNPFDGVMGGQWVDPTGRRMMIAHSPEAKIALDFCANHHSLHTQ